VGPDGEEYEFQLPDSGPEPDTVLQRKEALERLEEVIAELPPHYRAITLLRHDQQLSYEEIADILQLPLGTVKARIHRARNQIQQMLAARSYDI
jgi:RNA polymerase sigma-70 factor (ECF subfamily)